MTNTRSYKVRARYFDAEKGWQIDEELHENLTHEAAHAEASRVARVLDKAHGDSHFWTVELIHPETGQGYVQLFHGRLS